MAAKIYTVSSEQMNEGNDKKIVLNARKTAVGFYEKLGYERKGDMFTEVGIAHFKMHKYLI